MQKLPSSGAFQIRWTHQVLQCRDAFGQSGQALADLIPPADRPTRVLMVIDQGVATEREEILQQIKSWASLHADRFCLKGDPLIVPGGEQAKQDHTVVDQVIRAIHDQGICRRSVLMAIGGGAVLDAVGLAASLAHRGVHILRLPSTTLAQGDAGVGVKNAINAFGVKNLIGTFAPPLAVVNDTTLLTSLSPRDWRAGLSESIKVGLLKDPALVNTIEASVPALLARDLDAMEAIVMRSADLHVAHIVHGGDPFEFHRARPLDFGHWSAHCLEHMTGFRLSHGDAVGIGMLIDLQYAALQEGRSNQMVQRISDCLGLLGFPLHCDAMGDEERLLEGLERFREHLGGPLAITLVHAPGVTQEVDVIDEDCMRQAIRLVARRGTQHASQAG